MSFGQLARQTMLCTDPGGEEMIDRFVDDDAGYLSWLRNHPAGFVLNCGREPRHDYLVLHRAGCHTISGTPSRGDNWTTAFAKVCAGAARELDAWAFERTGAHPSPCALCA